ADRGEPAAGRRAVRAVLLAHHRGVDALRRRRDGLRGAAVDDRDPPLGSDDHRPGAPRPRDRRGAPGAVRAAPGAAVPGPTAPAAPAGSAGLTPPTERL